MSPGNSGFGRVAKFILMHEMCHVAKSRAWRGKVFKTEAIRIMAAGGINDF
jgi:hypothetical protein